MYRIEITNPTTGAPITPSSLGGLPISSLLPDGTFNPAALQVELDIPVAAQGYPGDAGAFVQIWGLGLQDIGSAFNLAPKPATARAAATLGANMTIFGGMSAGLPLANPAEQGPLVKGSVINAFGNWILTDQTVTMILVPPTGAPTTPMNLVLNWKAGQPLSAALQSTLSIAFPGIPVRMSISPNLTLNHDQQGYYQSLDELNDILLAQSKTIIKTPGYQGVRCIANGTNITVTDNTTPPAPKMIAFTDLIGQPTWIDTNTIQSKLVMRGDLAINDIIRLPATLQTTTGNAQLNFQDRTTFSGNFLITDLHHFGNFRQPDAASWNTTVNMVPMPNQTPTGTTTSAPGGSSALAG